MTQINETSTILDNAVENFHLPDQLLGDTKTPRDTWTVPYPILTQIAEAYAILDNEVENFHLIDQLFNDTKTAFHNHKEDIGLYSSISTSSHNTLITTTSTRMERNTTNLGPPAHTVPNIIIDTSTTPSSSPLHLRGGKDESCKAYVDTTASHRYTDNISFSTPLHYPASPIDSLHGCTTSLTSENGSKQSLQPHEPITNNDENNNTTPTTIYTQNI